MFHQYLRNPKNAYSKGRTHYIQSLLKVQPSWQIIIYFKGLLSVALFSICTWMNNKDGVKRGKINYMLDLFSLDVFFCLKIFHQNSLLNLKCFGFCCTRGCTSMASEKNIWMSWYIIWFNMNQYVITMYSTAGVESFIFNLLSLSFFPGCGSQRPKYIVYK